MLAGTRDGVGALNTLAAVVPAGSSFKGGVAISPTGQVYVTTTVSASDSFVNGYRVDATAVVTVVNSNGGTSRGASGQVITDVAIPTASSKQHGGTVLSSIGAVHIK